MKYNETIREYDANKNLIHFKTSNGVEDWYEYDANGNQIHYKSSCGYEYWYERDANGNLIHYKNSKGHQYWYERDANGNLIHYKDSDGIEAWYDSFGKKIDKPIEKKDNATMNEYYIKIYATSIESIDKALGDQAGKNGLGVYYVLTENSHSCSICHTDSHLYIERNEANDLAEYLLNKDKGYLEPRTGDKFYNENDD